MPRFQYLSWSKTTFINDRNVSKVDRAIVWLNLGPVHLKPDICWIRHFFFLNSKISQAWICLHALFLMNKTKDQISWVSPHDLYWEKKCTSEKGLFKLNSAFHSLPSVTGFALAPRVPRYLNVFRARAIKYPRIVAANLLCCSCCAAILVYCSVRDWTRYRIRCGFIFPLNLESGFKNIWIPCRICRIRVDGKLIRKEKVAN